MVRQLKSLFAALMLISSPLVFAAREDAGTVEASSGSIFDPIISVVRPIIASIHSDYVAAGMVEASGGNMIIITDPLTPSTARAMSLLPGLMDYVRTPEMLERVNINFREFLKAANQNLPLQTGHLILIKLKVDQTGNTVLAENFFVPMASGFNVFDAYSEYLNNIEPSSSVNLFDNRFFRLLWIEKTGPDQFNVTALEQRFARDIVRQGHFIADEKVSGLFSSPLAKTSPGPIDIALVQSAYLEANQAATAEQINKFTREYLTQRAQALHAQREAILAQHSNAMRRKKASLSILDALSLAVSIGKLAGDIPANAIMYDKKVHEFQEKLLQLTSERLNAKLKQYDLRISEIDASMPR